MWKQAEPFVERWRKAGLLDEETAARIREFEMASVPEGKTGLGAAIAWGLGALLIGAGIISFVAGNWEAMTPEMRLGLMVVVTAGFHLLGGLAMAPPALQTALHGIGTAALGAGIALTGQTFHLESGWNGWMMAWAAGAAVSWYLLRDGVQLAFVAVLVPLWVTAEFQQRFLQRNDHYEYLVAFWVGVGLAYFLSEVRSLVWIGAMVVMPAAILAATGGGFRAKFDGNLIVIAAVMLVVVAVAAWRWPGPESWVRGVAVATGEALVLAAIYAGKVEAYVLMGLAFVGLCAVGVRMGQGRTINLGVAGFGVVLLTFCVAHVTDLLDSAVGLIGMGVLLLGGGFGLEQARRRLLREAA
jgi:uncharacterized membrane protein